jgi:hypothetical protein
VAFGHGFRGEQERGTGHGAMLAFYPLFTGCPNRAQVT